MNKHFKHIKSLIENPTEWGSEYEAQNYLKGVVSNGRLKPLFALQYIPEGKRYSTKAVTLPKECVGSHKDFGFTVYAKIQEDYYEWVNFFLCVSNDGKSWLVGDFEDEVYASSKEFYESFIDKFEVEEWDYHDI